MFVDHEAMATDEGSALAIRFAAIDRAAHAYGRSPRFGRHAMVVYRGDDDLERAAVEIAALGRLAIDFTGVIFKTRQSCAGAGKIKVARVNNVGDDDDAGAIDRYQFRWVGDHDRRNAGSIAFDLLDVGRLDVPCSAFLRKAGLGPCLLAIGRRT